jgi:selenocysteine-specific elongation factor
MRRLILGTAGHIDHGKTALVRALTGIDTDRLPEEKRRGITIDIGFARLLLDDTYELGIVDVPGHESFVRNMLAGATGIDLVLLVVAADEGVMPQTREHLAIVELLGIRRGVVAITKSDLADPEWLQLVCDDVAQLLAPGPLAGAPLVSVSARTGAGLSELVQTLTDVAATVPQRREDDLFRMPIDRVFSVRGTGTVVTGTVWSGTLRCDEHVRIEPAGLSARVRDLQHHGTDADRVGPGERAAIALASLDRQLLRRGDTVVSGAGWRPAGTLTARLTMVRDAPAPLRPRQRVRVHVGTAAVLGRVALLDRELRAGESALVQLRLEQPLLTRAGDHAIIRSYSPVHTFAGAVILEPAAPKRKRLTPDIRAALDRVLDAAHGPSATLTLAAAAVPVSTLPVLSGLTPTAAAAAIAADPGVLVAGDKLIDAHRLNACTTALLAQVRAYHADHPLEDGIEREALRRMVRENDSDVFDTALLRAIEAGALETRGAAVAEPGFQPGPTSADRVALERLRAIFLAAGLQPPTLEELPPDLAATVTLPLLLRHLEREGDLIRTGAGRWTAAAALRDGVSALRSQLRAGELLDIAEFRKILGLSRKHLIPLLEFLDRAGVTVRQGDARLLVAGGGRVADPEARVSGRHNVAAP